MRHGHHFRRGEGPHLGENLLHIGCAVIVKNDQIRACRISVAVHRVFEFVRLEPADRGILRHDVRIGIALPQIGHDVFPPILCDNGLPVKEDLHLVAVFGSGAACIFAVANRTEMRKQREWVFIG